MCLQSMTATNMQRRHGLLGGPFFYIAIWLVVAGAVGAVSVVVAALFGADVVEVAVVSETTSVEEATTNGTWRE